MTLTRKRKIRWKKRGKNHGRIRVETVQRLRAMALLCRQSAAHHPDRSWKLLAEAEFWEHMASAALLEHFKECAASSNDVMQPQRTANSNDAHRIAAA